jgi:hypothetical protein
MDISLEWDPVVHSDLAGYKLYHSDVSGRYDQVRVATLGKTTKFTFTGEEKKTYFVVTAYSIHGEESDHSNEVCVRCVGAPIKLIIK